MSQAVADNLCNQVGLRTYGKKGFRMAEFHDGNGRNAGWSFWAEVDGHLSPPRYWVNINDQPLATPWNN